MYFDLFVPFPLPPTPDDGPSKKSKKGKGKAVAQSSTPAENIKRTCWTGLESRDKDAFVDRVSLAGHLGYSVVGLTVTPSEPSNQVVSCPFTLGLPFPDLDPRFTNSGGNNVGSSSKTPLVQVTRYHMRLDDNRIHPLTSQNTNALKAYDVLSVAPTSDKAFQLACTDLASPGPNQVSIITLPLHERPFTFRFNWKQMRQAQRNGVVFELLYSAGLFPPTNLAPDTQRRYRQNFLSNAREVIRITGGKGVIFSSGPGGDVNGLRGALDIVNLGTMIGMPSNLAKESISTTSKNVLLRAQARKTFKAVMSMPKLVPANADAEAEDDLNDDPALVPTDSPIDSEAKVQAVDGARAEKKRASEAISVPLLSLSTAADRPETPTKKIKV
ncbi:uncharacterized protein I303_103750 [Kwoniella dejecticola CBS 10117]|uniref:Uncharacterized protein n=1 Tax=Kwoniella dejecticola CBS 10117 TaxID=1296121 RepID=A0A1A6A7L4_9TREE|nr:uncharacterized protein I303_03767 [Kwoniella dejecticola CBS 10117]OBR86049.1 hypothetical protein I303_03767 [Kwoniella dejecticola CBS 10117]